MNLSLEGLRQAIQFLTLLASHCYLRVFSTGQIYKGAIKGTCLPVLSCPSCPSAIYSCPIGVVQHYAVIGQIPFFLLGLLGLVGMLVGRMACGWLCPFGLVQDLLYRIRSVKVHLPEQLSLLRYPVLLFLVLLLPYVTGESWFSILCPQGTLTAAIPWALWNPPDPLTHLPLLPPGSLGLVFGIKVSILVGFLVLFVISKRPFCRIACPLGLILSFFNRVSWVKLEVSGHCSQCDRCQELCPVDLKVYQGPNAGGCIRCLRCTECQHVKLTARPLIPDHASASMRMEEKGESPCAPPG